MGKDYCSFGRGHIRTWTRENRSISSMKPFGLRLALKLHCHCQQSHLHSFDILQISIQSNISSWQKTMATGSYTLPHLSSRIDFQWINSINISCSSIKY